MNPLAVAMDNLTVAANAVIRYGDEDLSRVVVALIDATRKVIEAAMRHAKNGG